MPNDRLSDNMGRLARAVEALYPTLSKIAGDNGGRGVDPGIGEDGRVRPSGRAADPGRAAVVGITVTGGSAEAVKAAPGLASAMALMKSVGAGGPAAFERSAAAMARALMFGIVILSIIVPPQTILLSLYTKFRYFDLFGLFRQIGRAHV